LPKRYNVGLVGAEDALVADLRGALADMARVVPIKLDDEASLTSVKVQVLLVTVDLAGQVGITPFVRCRNLNPTVPILILSGQLDAMIAVELEKCGADDVCRIPIEPDVLAKKVSRALDVYQGPAISIPALAPLASRGADGGANMRRVFRAPCSSTLPATAMVKTKSGVVTLRVQDISVPIDKHPGGVGLLCDAELSKSLPLDEWRTGASFKLRLTVATDNAAIDVVAKMAGPVRAARNRNVLIGMQYKTEHPADVGKLQAYWMACQRTAQDAKK
jgi:DNA-binding response OmpR family regulator